MSISYVRLERFQIGFHILHHHFPPPLAPLFLS